MTTRATRDPSSIPTWRSGSISSIIVTGDWSFYYHYDDATALQAIYGNNGLTDFARLSLSRRATNCLSMSNTKTFGATTVNVARIQFFRSAVRTAQPAASSAISDYGQYGFNTDPTTGGLVNSGPPRIPFLPATLVL